MSRRKAASKRDILPDSIWNSKLLARFINIVMTNGKKSVAEHIVYEAIQEVMKRKPNLLTGDKEGGETKETKELKEAKEPKALASSVAAATAKEQRGAAVIKHALDLVRPTVEVRSRRVGGATYQVPVEVDHERGEALAMRMLVDAAKQRGEHGMVARLVGELVDVFEGRGGALKKREDIHRMAKANQAFAHYHW